MGIREALLSTSKLASEQIVVPGVGEVTVQALRAGEFLSLRDACLVRGKRGRTRFDSQKFQTLLVAHCTRDEQGARVFSESDLGAIADMPSVAVERIAEAAARLCGITQTDEDDLGEASAPGEAPGESSSTLPNS